jgi:hypothetical protein
VVHRHRNTTVCGLIGELTPGKTGDLPIIVRTDAGRSVSACVRSRCEGDHASWVRTNTHAEVCSRGGSVWDGIATVFGHKVNFSTPGAARRTWNTQVRHGAKVTSYEPVL